MLLTSCLEILHRLSLAKSSCDESAEVAVAVAVAALLFRVAEPALKPIWGDPPDNIAFGVGVI